MLDLPPKGIDALPTDWECQRLDHFTSYISYGFTNPMPTTLSGPLMVTAADVKNGKVDVENARRTSETAYSKELSDKSRPKENDILLTKDGALGRVALVGTERMCINQSVALLRPNKRIVPKFFAHLLQGNLYQEKMLEDAGGSTIKHIYITIVNEMPIAVPTSLSEQQAIAEALSDADGLVEGLERLIEKKRRIKQGAMQDLLTAKRRLPGFSGEWSAFTIDAVAYILDNLRIPLNEPERRAMPGTIPYCGANGVVDYVGQHLIDDDVILMAEDGGYFDEFETRPIAYRMIGKIWVNNHAHVLKAKSGFDHGFLFHSLRHKDITSFLASGTRAKLNKGELKKIKVRAPIDLSEQHAISSVFDDMDAEITALETRLQKARAIKEGMMQNLLTGRIRLV